MLLSACTTIRTTSAAEDPITATHTATSRPDIQSEKCRLQFLRVLEHARTGACAMEQGVKHSCGNCEVLHDGCSVILLLHTRPSAHSLYGIGGCCCCVQYNELVEVCLRPNTMLCPRYIHVSTLDGTCSEATWCLLKQKTDLNLLHLGAVVVLDCIVLFRCIQSITHWRQSSTYICLMRAV